jgi:SAM-dependent methyltransferase
MNSQSQAQERYFGHARREIAPLLPDQAQRVLEIGCSSGATLAWLRDRWPHAEMLGVDGHAPLAPVIRARAAQAVIHDLETPLPDLGTFDLILALAVLGITPVHALRILISPRVHGVGARLRGVACLAQIRGLRVREMIAQWADPTHEGATGWNRGA